jgi:hypothetical protein
VHVGAILTIPNGVRLQRERSQSALSDGHNNTAADPNTAPIARWDLLGKSVLDRVLERLQMFGVSEASVIAEQATDAAADAGDATNAFWSAWDAAISRYLQFDLQTLLLVRAGPYAEVDVADWLHFHRETASAMTQVYDQHGALDLVAIDAKRLARGEGSFRNRLRSLIPKHRRYSYSGYSNRLSDIRDFHRLMEDALCGRAAIHPIGEEVQANVWANETARIADSARIVAPAYIGRNSRVNAGCTISSSVIEEQSEVDCGTTVNDSCVLGGSYVGAGLKVRGAVVYQDTFFHLGRNIRLQFRDHRLFGRNLSTRRFLPRRRPAAAGWNRQSSVQ